jgi:hypothetical protein
MLTIPRRASAKPVGQDEGKHRDRKCRRDKKAEVAK